MIQKRIAETINIRINLGNFQHIDITKYAEKNIEYSSQEEMISQENQLTDELLDNIIRNMKRIPERLGKKTNAVTEVEESIKKEIPRWLEENPEPNIANNAKKIHNGKVSEQKESKDNEEKKENKIDEEILSNTAKPENKSSDIDVPKITTNDKEEDLFNDSNKIKDKKDSDDLFNDDDLFN